MNVQSNMDKVTDKQTIIINTALELLVENGFHNTPMSLIAKRAGVSAGIIYHYFESKDDLIHQIYQEINQKMSQALISNQTDQLEGIALLKQIWLDMFNFYIAHPNETLFLEQYKNSPFYHNQQNVDEEWSALSQKVEQAMAEGTIISLPLMVFYNLTVGVAMALAKQQIAKIIDLDKATLEKVADAVCRAAQPI